MLFKGWAVAQHYGRPHMRPIGDVDLCVPTADYFRALELLSRHAAPPLSMRTDNAAETMIPLAVGSGPGAEVVVDRISLAKLVKAAGLAESTSDATRKIQQGAVRVDREKITDTKAWIDEKRREIVLQVGRRAVKVHLNRP